MITAQQVVALRPLKELADAWGEHLQAKGTIAAQVTLVTRRARRVGTQKATVADAVSAISDLQADFQGASQFLGIRGHAAGSIAAAATSLGGRAAIQEEQGVRGRERVLSAPATPAGAERVLVARPVFKTGVPDDLR